MGLVAHGIVDLRRKTKLRPCSSHCTDLTFQTQILLDLECLSQQFSAILLFLSLNLSINFEQACLYSFDSISG
uniref:Putative ovule protein n=1 Tax=Solanum chacoense TaxID=4108 RepID=A0A0V0H3B4_SOLCH